MAVRIQGTYTGNKKLELLHEPSGTVIRTAAPVDNNGDGSSFSPTDLFSASLGACMLTVISIVAEREGVDLAGSHFTVEKHMSTTPRRVGKLVVDLHLPKALDSETRVKYERTGATCPVHHSLHSDIDVVVSYHYDV